MIDVAARAERRRSWISDSQTLRLWRRATSYWTARLGLALLVLLAGIAFVGPFVAPHSESDAVDIPNLLPSSRYLMGTDALGRDVLSRFLFGGHTVIELSFAATAIGYMFGILIGLLAGYRRGATDFALMRIVDVLLSFPSIILALILVAGFGTSLWVIVAGVALTHVPRVARVVRAVSMETSVQAFVERAEARGERTLRILLREILPNVWTPILADFGIRLSTSVILVASLSFLGFGLRPPAADWALMINENRTAVFEQPWAVAFPAIAIGLLTIAVNLLADGFARAVGRSVNREQLST